MCPLIRTLKTSLSVYHCVQHNPRKAARCETKINNVVSRSYIPVRGVICDSKWEAVSRAPSVERRVSAAPVSRAPQLIITNYQG